MKRLHRIRWDNGGLFPQRWKYFLWKHLSSCRGGIFSFKPSFGLLLFQMDLTDKNVYIEYPWICWCTWVYMHYAAYEWSIRGGRVYRSAQRLMQIQFYKEEIMGGWSSQRTSSTCNLHSCIFQLVHHQFLSSFDSKRFLKYGLELWICASILQHFLYACIS